MTPAASPQPRIKTGQYTFVEHREGTPELHAPVSRQELAFVNIVGDNLTPEGEATAARGAIAEAAADGAFGDDVLVVHDLAADDRLVRLAVDRFVVNEFEDHGSQHPDQTGKLLGQYLIDIHEEDAEPGAAGSLGVPVGAPDNVLAEDADRMLRGSLTTMRNSLDSRFRTGSHYFGGVAAGEAEVAAALLEGDADPDVILARSRELLVLGPADLTSEQIRGNTAAPLSPDRARRLAGYFTSRAVELQQDLGAKDQDDWTPEEWVKQGTKFAFSKAAVRFADRTRLPESSYHEDRFTRLIAEGETDTETILGGTFDEGSW